MSDVVILCGLKVGLEVDLAVVFKFHGGIGVEASPEIHDDILEFTGNLALAHHKGFREILFELIFDDVIGSCLFLS